MKTKYLALLLLYFLGFKAMAETKPANPVNWLGIRYLSFRDRLDVTDGLATQKSQAAYYGLALQFETKIKRKDISYGFFIGASFGRADGGTSSGDVGYLKVRNTWSGFLGGLRLFKEIYEGVEIGLTPTFILKQVKWAPKNDNQTIDSGSQILSGVLLDIRYRATSNWDIVQSFGTIAKDQSLFWNIGASYALF